MLARMIANALLGDIESATEMDCRPSSMRDSEA